MGAEGLGGRASIEREPETGPTRDRCEDAFAVRGHDSDRRAL